MKETTPQRATTMPINLTETAIVSNRNFAGYLQTKASKVQSHEKIIFKNNNEIKIKNRTVTRKNQNKKVINPADSKDLILVSKKKKRLDSTPELRNHGKKTLIFFFFFLIIVRI
jgi:hypothetical protein